MSGCDVGTRVFTRVAFVCVAVTARAWLQGEREQGGQGGSTRALCLWDGTNPRFPFWIFNVLRGTKQELQ